MSIFNDVILTAANDLWDDYHTTTRYGNVTGANYPLIDLRNVCRDDKCFANPIEPSEYGGDKITDAILEIVLDH